MIRDDGRKAAAKLVPILEVVGRLGIEGLRKAGAHERVGPCPVCGGHDRFGINASRGVFNCRHCGASGDGLALVQHVLSCDFQAALDYLVGKADIAPDPAEVERRQRAFAQAEAHRRDTEEKLRARAIRDAREIWHAAGPGAGTEAEAYLAGRGIAFPGGWPPTLRFLPAHPYHKHWPGRGVVEWMRGPCMIAAVQNAQGRVTAVHQTWVDPARPGAKATITAPDGSTEDAKGKPWPAKLVRGSKKGGAIRLTPVGNSGVLVMGEGIETTASALAAKPAACAWAGVDLGNMSGVQVKVEGTRHSGQPDLNDATAFVPPPTFSEFWLIQDGDSHPKDTRARLLSCLRRAKHHNPGLRGWIVRADDGADLNDMKKREVE